MNYPESPVQRWAAYASILDLLVSILSLVVSVLGVWESYIAPYIASTSRPSTGRKTVLGRRCY